MCSGFCVAGAKLSKGLVRLCSHPGGAPEDSIAGAPSEKARTKAHAASKDAQGKKKAGKAKVKTNCGPASQWTVEEHARFLAALDKFGNAETQAGAHCGEGSPQRRGAGLGKSVILIPSLCSDSISLTSGASQGLEWQI